MEITKVELKNARYGEVQIFSDDIKAGKMRIGVADGKLTVYHTEVNSEFEGRGFAKLLLAELVNYAKSNLLKIVPLCPFVNAQFHRFPEIYKDVWLKDSK